MKRSTRDSPVTHRKRSSAKNRFAACDDEVALRHDAQWQYWKRIGGSITSKDTLPHRQLPLVVDIDILFAKGPKLTIGALVLGKVLPALLTSAW
jgi:hypothetical protein